MIPSLLPAHTGPDGERTVAHLRPGDIVQHADEDYLVEGVIAFDEDGHRWIGARLTDGSKYRWLYVGMERMGSISKRWLDLRCVRPNAASASGGSAHSWEAPRRQ